MNASTIAIIKKSIDLAKHGIEYIEHDNKVSLGLRKPQWIGFEGIGIGRGDFDNGVLNITSLKNSEQDGADNVVLEASVFSALMRFWNGPDLINNKVKDGRLEASLWHDLIWRFAKEIAATWGCSEDKVYEWANSLFYAAWKDYGSMYPSAKLVTQKARVAYGVVSFAAPWYHKLKRLFGLALVVLCVCGGCEGCALFNTPPDDVTVTGSSGTFGDESVESIEPWISTNVVEGVR